MKSFRIIYSFTILLFFILSICTSQQIADTEEIAELTDEQYDEIRNMYRIEEKLNEKPYQEVTLHPERYDINKDKRISRRELAKAISFLIFPKTRGEREAIYKGVTKQVKARINNFVNNKPEFLTYRQFSAVIIQLKGAQFVDSNYLDDVAMAESIGNEYENEL